MQDGNNTNQMMENDLPQNNSDQDLDEHLNQPNIPSQMGLHHQEPHLMPPNDKPIMPEPQMQPLALQ